MIYIIAYLISCGLIMLVGYKLASDVRYGETMEDPTDRCEN